MVQNKKILMIEDEVKIVEVIKSYLEKEGYKVFGVHNGKDGMAAFDRFNPSLVILDLMLPDMTGEDICKAIRKKSRVPIIMLTAKIDEPSILYGFDIGADDYVTKPFSPKQLVARVKTLLKRTEHDLSPMANILDFNNNDLIVDSGKHEVKKNGEFVNLTPSEYKVLMSLLKYPKKTFTREELVCIALGKDYEGFERIIDTHIKNLRQKIETNPREPQYILTVHGIGYKFGGE